MRDGKDHAAPQLGVRRLEKVRNIFKAFGPFLQKEDHDGKWVVNNERVQGGWKRHKPMQNSNLINSCSSVSFSLGPAVQPDLHLSRQSGRCIGLNFLGRLRAEPPYRQRTGKTTPFLAFAESSLNVAFALASFVFPAGHAERSKGIMKKILTHLIAFLLGVISLPVIIYVVINVSPNLLPDFLELSMRSAFPPDRGVEALNKAKNEEERFYALGDAAKESFCEGKYSEAQEYANELSTLVSKFKGNWNYGNAIQDYNLVLGRIALIDGKIQKAKEYLIEAGKSPGSPQMDTFGPNMSLAKDLLKKGEKEVVIEYLTLCKSFWEMNDGRLDEWIVLIKAGRIPNFGANLVY